MYPPGNPHHVHEYEPEEFEQALAERFAHVLLHRQTPWLASTILSDAEFAASGSDESFSLRTVKTEPKEPGEETFTIAVAARKEIPSPQSLLTLGEPFEVRWWREQVEAHELANRAHEEEIAALRQELMAASREAASAQESRRRSAQSLLTVEESLAQ